MFDSIADLNAGKSQESLLNGMASRPLSHLRFPRPTIHVHVRLQQSFALAQ